MAVIFEAKRATTTGENKVTFRFVFKSDAQFACREGKSFLGPIRVSLV